jgi:hypothetical protein
MVKTRKDASKRMEQGQRKERVGSSGKKRDGKDRGAPRTPPCATLRWQGLKRASPIYFLGLWGLEQVVTSRPKLSLVKSVEHYLERCRWQNSARD